MTRPAPRGQCWEHAHNSRRIHKHLAPRENCPECVNHMTNGHPDQMIVK
ncbi:pRL2-8 [Streptomyces xanthochromogenes]